MSKTVEINWDKTFGRGRNTFELSFAARAWLPFIIDGEEHEVQIGISGTGDSAGHFITTDVWIDQLEGAPEFELTEELKEELSEFISQMDEEGYIGVID